MDWSWLLEVVAVVVVVLLVCDSDVMLQVVKVEVEVVQSVNNPLLLSRIKTRLEQRRGSRLFE